MVFHALFNRRRHSNDDIRMAPSHFLWKKSYKCWDTVSQLCRLRLRNICDLDIFVYTSNCNHGNQKYTTSDQALYNVGHEIRYLLSPLSVSFLGMLLTLSHYFNFFSELWPGWPDALFCTTCPFFLFCSRAGVGNLLNLRAWLSQ